ncbi:MAG: prenyltransferase/squalene oxidase repeat-containing protein [Candidatus Competibacteraceae bacterium]
MGSYKRIAVTIDILVILITIVAGQTSFAQSLQTTNGINYLQTTQTANGSWGGATTSLNGIVPTTAAALKALRAVEIGTSNNQTDAIQFLTTEAVEVTPFWAARIVALAGTGSDTITDRDTLLSRQNPDGGWGTTEGFQSDPLDTAYVLIALGAVNHSDTSVLFPALNYLRNQQNSDGGWPLTEGGESRVFVTAPGAASPKRLPPAIHCCSEPVLASSVSVTSSKPMAVMANPIAPLSKLLWCYGQSMRPVCRSQPQKPLHQDYLLNQQLANGSWADDACSTALAILP